MFCMKRSLSTSKSNLQNRHIIFVLNEIFNLMSKRKKNCDFSKILQFSETVIVLIFKTKTFILFILLFFFFWMCIIQIYILEK